MKKLAFALGGAIAMSACPILAQEQQTTHRAMLRYSRAAEITVQGVVEDVRPHSSITGLVGAYLVLRTPTQTLYVHLGMSCPTEGQFIPGETIQVTGSALSQQHDDLFLARQVKKGGQILTIRNLQGLVISERGLRSPSRTQ